MRGEFPELNEVRKKSIHTIIRHDHMSKHISRKVSKASNMQVLQVPKELGGLGGTLSPGTQGGS